MTNPKPDAEAAVTKFKDYEVITPPNKLEKAVVHARPSEHYEPDPVARAEQALLTLSNDFAQWMEAECRRLDAARRKVREAGLTDAARDELFRAAHDIKGEAATFGFPLIEPVARSLCRRASRSCSSTSTSTASARSSIATRRAIRSARRRCWRSGSAR